MSIYGCGLKSEGEYMRATSQVEIHELNKLFHIKQLAQNKPFWNDPF